MTEESGVGKFFLVIGIMCALVIALYAYKSWQVEQDRAENRYNGYDFALAKNIWVTRIELSGQPYDVPFYFHPRETESVIVHENVTDPLLKYPVNQVFISLDPDAGAIPVIAGVEIAKITGSKYNILNLPTQSALSRETETPVQVPIVRCEHAGNGTVVIQFVEDPTTNAIVSEGSCVILFYKNPEESKRVADRYAYMLLQIMR